MIDQLILGLLVAMFASFGGVAWKFRGRIEKLPKEATEEIKADLLKAIEENRRAIDRNGEAIAGNRDRIDELRKDLGDRIDGNRDRIDEVRKDLGDRIDRNRDRIEGNRDRIDELRKDLGARIDGNRDQIDEVRKELSEQLGGQIGYTNRRIDDIYRHLVGGSSDSPGDESGA